MSVLAICMSSSVESKIWHKWTYLQNRNRLGHRHRHCGWQVGGGVGRDGLGVWGWQMQTITLRTDKQQVLMYGTENYVQYPVINPNGKEYFKRMYLCV